LQEVRERRGGGYPTFPDLTIRGIHARNADAW